MPEKKIRPIFPELAKSSEYWRVARTVIDTQIFEPQVRLVCGSVFSWGKYCILCVREENGGKVIQEGYFSSEDWDDPVLKEGREKIQIVLPSGFVLIEVERKPTQPPTNSGPATNPKGP